MIILIFQSIIQYFKHIFYQDKSIIYPNGTIKYFQNDELHNPNGPAIIWNDGTHEYYLYNTQIQKEDLHAPIQLPKTKIWY